MVKGYKGTKHSESWWDNEWSRHKFRHNKFLFWHMSYAEDVPWDGRYVHLEGKVYSINLPIFGKTIGDILMLVPIVRLYLNKRVGNNNGGR